ncbi:MAG: formate dehydrogenase accessory sulfurtransferase FdhD [Myxococcota bacterium]
MGRGAPGEPTAVRRVVRWPEGAPTDDVLAREEPLEIRVEDRAVAVTMRTPGADLDLAAGFLFTEGIVDGADDLVALEHLPGDADGNTVVARVAGGVEAHAEAVERATRALYATSACGICGKASLERIRLLAPPVRPVALDPEVLRWLPERLRAAQPAFDATGGLHGAALVALDGAIEVVREDIGRHNAVDKVLGSRLRADRVPVDDRVLVVTSRAGFELVQKARMAGVPALVAMGAASDLAVDLAVDGGMALVGFLREDRYVRYA